MYYKCKIRIGFQRSSTDKRRKKKISYFILITYWNILYIELNEIILIWSTYFISLMCLLENITYIAFICGSHYISIEFQIKFTCN